MYKKLIVILIFAVLFLMNLTPAFAENVTSSFIYVNNPEWISDLDIIKPRTGNDKNQLIYKQTNVSGYNTMYVTQSTLNRQIPANKNFYYDIDFHNASSSIVSMKVKKPYYRVNSGWDPPNDHTSHTTYEGLRFLYEERLDDSNPISDVIYLAPGEHKLLFTQIMPAEFGGASGLLVPNTNSFIAIFCDFEAQGEVTVRALATYYNTPEYLTLSPGANGNLKAGTTNKIDVNDDAPYAYNRIGESDGQNKFKGWEQATDEVIARLRYVVDQYTENGNLYVNITDEHIASNTKNPQSMWIANISPFSDTGSAWQFCLPSNLNAFDYTDSRGNWKFDFKHMNGKDDGSTNFSGSFDGYQNRLISSYYLNNFSNLSNLSLAEREWLASLVFAMGNWGIKYTHYIDIYNTGNNSRTIQFNMATGNFLATIYTVREFSPTATVDNNNYSDGSYISYTSKSILNNGWAVRGIFDSPITIPPGTRRVIRISYLFGVGTSGFQNSLVLGN